MVTMFRIMLAMVAGLSQNAINKTKLLFNQNFGYSKAVDVNNIATQLPDKSIPFVDMPCGSEIRQKLKSLGSADRQAAILFLQDELGDNLADKLQKFEQQEGFQRIIISKDKLLKIAYNLAKRLTNHTSQKAVLLIMLAVTTASQQDMKVAGCIDLATIKTYANYAERTQSVLLLDGDNDFRIVTSTGKVIPSSLVKGCVQSFIN
ncbi:MAG: hypothetical protein CL947_00090 [Epsilonproteobacteria bacterium]|nr:hypothetical protein [Campylobacterota bacterium]